VDHFIAADAAHVDSVEVSAQSDAVACGRVRVRVDGPEGRREGRVSISLIVRPDGVAFVSVQGKPMGDQPDDIDGGWREIVISASHYNAAVRGQEVPESAEAFLRRVLTAAQELAEPI
jgi:hypothetical protein